VPIDTSNYCHLVEPATGDENLVAHKQGGSYRGGDEEHTSIPCRRIYLEEKRQEQSRRDGRLGGRCQSGFHSGHGGWRDSGDGGRRHSGFHSGHGGRRDSGDGGIVSAVELFNFLLTFFASVLTMDIDQIRMFIAQSGANAVRSGITVFGGTFVRLYSCPVLSCPVLSPLLYFHLTSFLHLTLNPPLPTPFPHPSGFRLRRCLLYVTHSIRYQRHFVPFDRWSRHVFLQDDEGRLRWQARVQVMFLLTTPSHILTINQPTHTLNIG
jgi:hypothetical protein